jgi:hypothetical protein
MINDYLRGEHALRVLGGVFILSFSCSFRDFVVFVPFVGFCDFPSSR